LWHISILSFPSGDMAIFFQISSISLWQYDHFFSKFKNKKFKFKNENVQFVFKFFLWHKRIFFLDPRLLNLLKDCKNYLFTLTKKIVIYCIPPPAGRVHRKRASQCVLCTMYLYTATDQLVFISDCQKKKNVFISGLWYMLLRE
jgi:hypothetical protein